MSEQLKPCPFCGCAPRRRIQIDESLWNHDAVEWLTIVCDECGCESDSSEIHDDVVESWNRRADPLAASHQRLKEALDHIIRRLQMDIEDGSRPDQWSMEDLVRVAHAALKDAP